MVLKAKAKKDSNKNPSMFFKAMKDSNKNPSMVTQIKILKSESQEGIK